MILMSMVMFIMAWKLILIVVMVVVCWCFWL